jgi:predicted phosphodiesterase
MRIHVASDLHLEFLHRQFPSYLRIDRLYAPWADVLVLAGDIHNGTETITLFKDWPLPVLYVLGNHEFFDQAVEPAIDALRARAEGTAVRVLSRDAWIHDGVRFLGCTLWTDYELMGSRAGKARAMMACEAGLADHRKIKGVHKIGERFSAERALSLHERDRAWLSEQLALPFEGSTVVVTHHGPHPGSIHERFEGNPCNPGFISNLTPLVEQADVWIHGHVHDSFDYRVGKCRVVANPGSYAGGLKRARDPSELVWENPLFDPQKLVEV